MSSLRAGAATTNITPDRPLPNYYGASFERDPDSDLLCHALCLECGDTRGALVSLDATFIDRSLVLVIREQCEVATGVPGANICIAATHTHVAPPLDVSFLAGSPADPLYRDMVAQRTLQAVTAAANALENAALFAGTCPTPGIEHCRRLIRPGDGQSMMAGSGDCDPSWSPEGQADREMQWAIFEGKEGEPLAAIINWPVHSNCCSGKHYHRDLFGRAGDALRDALGVAIPTVTFAAPCGDIIWRDPKDPNAPRGDDFARRTGAKLARNVLQARRQARPMHAEDLRVLSDIAPIADRSFEDSTWCHDGCRGSSPEAIEFARNRYDPEREAVKQRGPTSRLVEIQGFGLGDLGIVTNPAELFCEFGVQIKRRSSFPATMVVELANDACGYVPYRRSFEHGGYETHRTCWTSRLIPEAGEIITRRSVEVLDRLRT